MAGWTESLRKNEKEICIVLDKKEKESVMLSFSFFACKCTSPTKKTFAFHPFHP